MKENSQARTLTSSGTQEVGTFGFSPDSTVHIMTILRDTLYTDRILAVLREYSSNAWDAHREAGKADLPIKVTLPTILKPTLVIRDYGLGLSDSDVMLVYTQYGKSSKRNTDDMVGAFGIGCKSAFAYTDQFTVTSWYEGVKSVYVAVLDESNLGEMRRLDTSPCPPEETGIEIQVPVVQTDIQTFYEKASFLFPAFTPQPDINTPLPAPISLTKGIGYINLKSSRWVAVMGCVPYRIDTAQLGDRVARAIHSIGGAVYFDIGDVEISASREDLKYTEKTLKALQLRFEELQDAYLEDMGETLGEKSHWEQRLLVHKMGTSLGFPIPDEFKNLSSRSGEIYTDQLKASTFSWKNSVIRLEDEMTLYIHDDLRKLSGFLLKYPSVVVRPHRKRELEKVEKELAEVLEKAHLSGIPIERTSGLTFYGLNVNDHSDAEINPKHQVKTFVLHPGKTHSDPKSNRWGIVDRTPTDDDVYILIDRFDRVGDSNWYNHYRDDWSIAEILGVVSCFPPVYGYKPAASKKARGVDYDEWRKSFFKQHLTPDIKGQIKTIQLLNTFNVVGMNYRRFKLVTDIVVGSLGKTHPLSKVFRKLLKAQELNNKNHILKSLARTFRIKDTRAQKKLDSFTEKYPLVFAMGGIRYLGNQVWDGKADELLYQWVEYIKMVDRDHQNQEVAKP